MVWLRQVGKGQVNIKSNPLRGGVLQELGPKMHEKSTEGLGR